MDKEEFLKRYRDGEKDFSGIELKDVDLSGKGFSEIKLHKAKLTNVNLSNSYLSNANLSEADLSGSDLFEANLERANLRNAILTNTNLDCTKLIGADLTGSNIDEAKNVSSPHLLVVDEKKNNNTELVRELRELTRGIHNYHNTEGSYPIDVFMWDTVSRGDFTLEKFLEAAGFLVKVDSIDFLDNTFPVKEFSLIVEKIKPYITVEREYYYLKIGIGRIDEFDEGILSILIGKTKTGDWIGICPSLDICRGGREEFGRIEDNSSKKIEHASLVSILKSLEEVEIFSEETLYDASEGIAWEIAETRDNLLHNLLKTTNIMHFYNDYEDGDFGGEGFFGENDEDSEMNSPEEYKKLKRLSNIIKTRFKYIKIYWIGHYGQIDVYIVGKIETGDWVGIRSRLCHT
ncbi:pentapeptide repeat family protein [Calothrix parasitica NIES-267]|uniref:Pentapeptide repeat family protein n=1 Tax=Calothrix parasitica NIES-267 TaxID=1973488 RepID=A0A1Z4LNX1_9CYAN|nr:pentapeptide repeat family protein [Calothrix parasitica NIES-267]